MLGNTEVRRRGRQRMRWLDGITDLMKHEFEQAPGDGDGQGNLVCCSPWGHKEWDTTEWLNNNSNCQAIRKKNYFHLYNLITLATGSGQDCLMFLLCSSQAEGGTWVKGGNLCLERRACGRPTKETWLSRILKKMKDKLQWNNHLLVESLKETFGTFCKGRQMRKQSYTSPSQKSTKPSQVLLLVHCWGWHQLAGPKAPGS